MTLSRAMIEACRVLVEKNESLMRQLEYEYANRTQPMITVSLPDDSPR